MDEERKVDELIGALVGIQKCVLFAAIYSRDCKPSEMLEITNLVHELVTGDKDDDKS